MLRTEIDKNEPLFPGDVIEMHFKAYGPNWVYLKAAELAILKWKLEQKHPDYELISWQAPVDKLILTFKIRKPPVISKEKELQIQEAGVGVTAAIVGVFVIGAGLFAWLSLDTVYRISKSPAGQIALAGTGIVGAVFVVIVGYLILSRHYGWGD